MEDNHRPLSLGTRIFSQSAAVVSQQLEMEMKGTTRSELLKRSTARPVSKPPDAGPRRDAQPSSANASSARIRRRGSPAAWSNRINQFQYFNCNSQKVGSVDVIPTFGWVSIVGIVYKNNACGFFRRDATIGEDELDFFGPAGVGHTVNDAFGRENESTGRA